MGILESYNAGELTTSMQELYKVKYGNVANMINHVALVTTIKEKDGVVSTTGLTSGPCHACVNTIMSRPNTDAVLTYTVAPEFHKGAVKWFNWLANKSPFASAFLSKDGKKIIENKGFLLTTKVHSALWLGAAQLGRLYTSEYRQQAKMIYACLEEGLEVNPLLLALLATNLTFVVNDKKEIYSLYNLENLRYRTQSSYVAASGHFPLSDFPEDVSYFKDWFSESEDRSFNPKHDADIKANSADKQFKQKTWQGYSNTVLQVDPANKLNIGDSAWLMSETLKGEGTKLGQLPKEAAKEAEYTSLWPKASKMLEDYLFKTSVAKTKSGAAGIQPINLQPLVKLTKDLGLGVA